MGGEIRNWENLRILQDQNRGAVRVLEKRTNRAINENSGRRRKQKMIVTNIIEHEIEIVSDYELDMGAYKAIVEALAHEANVSKVYLENNGDSYTVFLGRLKKNIN